MFKVLLPVDGSESAERATRKLIETAGWCKEQPKIDLLTVHLPVPPAPQYERGHQRRNDRALLCG